MKHFLYVVILVSQSSAFALNPKRTFEKKCSNCHTIGQDDSDQGPDLKGITLKRSKNWLIEYIQSSSTLIKNGDQTAIDLAGVYKNKNAEKMPDYDSFGEEDVQQLLAYIEAKGAGSDAEIAEGMGNAAAGQLLSRSCVNCHGNLGITSDQKIPNLAGQNAQYMIAQLKAYKAGLREDLKGNMNDLARSLTLRDIVNISTYFSTLKN